MAEIYGPLNGPGPQQIYLVCYAVSQSQSGNYTQYYGGLVYVGTGSSWTNATQYWSTSTNFGALASGTFTIPSPGGSNITLWTGYFNIYHDANGYMPSMNFGGSIDTNHTTIGDGSIAIIGFVHTRIPKPSAAPYINTGGFDLGWDQVATDSARFRFSGHGETGGGAHVRWEVEYWKTGGTRKIISSSGTSIITGLDPGSEYNGRARQITRGIDGSEIAGAWSVTDTMTTLSGVLVGNGSAWVAQPLRIGNGSAWVNYMPQIGDGDSWEDPLDV